MAWEMKWHYFGGTDCLISSRQEDESVDVIDKLILMDSGDLKQTLSENSSLSTNALAQLYPGVIQLVYESVRETQRYNWEAKDWGLDVLIRKIRIPEKHDENTKLLAREILLRPPNLLILPWPFPIDVNKKDILESSHRGNVERVITNKKRADLLLQKAEKTEVAFPSYNYDRKRDLALRSVMFAIDKLIRDGNDEEKARLKDSDEAERKEAIINYAEDQLIAEGKLKTYDNKLHIPDTVFIDKINLKSESIDTNLYYKDGKIRIYIGWNYVASYDEWPCGTD